MSGVMEGPEEAPVIYLRTTESEARQLRDGIVPDVIRQQASDALDWFDADPETGYAKAFTRLAHQQRRAG